MAFSSFFPHDTVYYNDDHSTDSDLDFVEDDDPTGYNRVDSYDFFHDTDTVTSTDIPHGFTDEYYSYIDNNYIEANKGYNTTLMRKLTGNDIANHIKEIINDVTPVNFDKIYSYERRQMVVNQFEKIF